MRGAPQPGLAYAHSSNQFPHIHRDWRSTLTRATLPGPVQPKAFAMPGDHRLRFHDAKGRSPVRPHTGEPDPEETIGDRQPQALFLVPALEDEKLMAQGKDFCLECNSCTERITQDGEQGNQGRHHRRVGYRSFALSSIDTVRIEFLVGTASYLRHETVVWQRPIAGPWRRPRQGCRIREIDPEPRADTGCLTNRKGRRSQQLQDSRWRRWTLCRSKENIGAECLDV